MNKQINLQEFEDSLKITVQEFKGINSFGFIGLMGSLNIEHDLDLVISPARFLMIGKFLKNLHIFMGKLRENLRRKGFGLIVFNYSILQEEVSYLSNREPSRDFLVHIVSFPDINLANHEIFENFLRINKVFYGSKNEVLGLDFSRNKFHYDYLFLSNTLWARYPEELETLKVKKKVGYISKYAKLNLNLENKTNEQIYFECCDALDNLTITELNNELKGGCS